MRAVLLLTVASLYAGTARADRAVVVVGGGAAPHARTIVETALTSALAGLGWPIPDGIGDRDRDAIAACAEHDHPWACIAPIVKRKSIDRAVVVAVERDGSDTNLVLTASLVLAGETEAVRSREFCQSCSDSLLEQTARGLAVTIVGHAQRLTQATVAITTEPKGAAITVDDKPEGKSPATIVTTAGSHTIVVARAGFATETRRVDLVAGKQSELDLELQPESNESVALPAILVGSGIVAVGIGTVISLRVEPPPPTEPQPKTLYSGPGIALAVAGGVAVLVGAYLWLRPHAGTPTVAATSGGGAVGWAIDF